MRTFSTDAPSGPGRALVDENAKLRARCDALTARVARLESTLVEIRTHPNASFNVAACHPETPTIMVIAGNALADRAKHE